MKKHAQIDSATEDSGKGKVRRKKVEHLEGGNGLQNESITKSPLDWIKYSEGFLNVSNLRYDEIIDKFGTPVLIFSKNRLIDNIETIKRGLEKHYKDSKIFFAYKSCYLYDILKILKESSVGAEITSLLEYNLAKIVNVPTHDMVFNGPGKTLEELEIVVDEDICINVESLWELKMLNKLCEEKGKTIEVGIRVYPQLGALESRALVKSGSKFGFDIATGEALNAYKFANSLKNINPVGIHTHVAQGELSPELHTKATSSLVSFLKLLEDKFGLQLKYFDIGGGFESRYLMERNGFYIEYFFKEISQVLSSLSYQPTLFIEPGRYIVGDAAVALTQIVSRKKNGETNWLLTDICANTLIPLKSAFFEVIPTRYDSKEFKESFNLGDRLCYTAGVLQKNCSLPSETTTGDYLCVLNCGAYTTSMWEHFMTVLPLVLLLDNSHLHVIKRREEEDKVAKLIMAQSSLDTLKSIEEEV